MLTRDADDPDAPLHYAKVTQLFRHVVTDLQLVTVTEVGGAGATETFEVTDEHPFYVENYGWIGAASLAVGMHVVSPDGAVLTVTANVDEQKPDGIVVYNFEVDGSHTYFVDQSLGDGVLGVWVHNACVSTKDAAGRIVRIEGTVLVSELGSGTAPSSAARRAIQALGRAVGKVFDASHILAYALGGRGGIRGGNIVAILREINRGEMATFERGVAKAMRAAQDGAFIVAEVSYVGATREVATLDILAIVRGRTFSFSI